MSSLLLLILCMVLTVIRGNSTTVTELNKPPPKSLSEKWDELPTGAKAGVGIGAGAAGAIGIAGLILYCIKQRRKGRLENALDDSNWNQNRAEMSNFQTDWKQSELRNKGYQPVS